MTTRYAAPSTHLSPYANRDRAGRSAMYRTLAGTLGLVTLGLVGHAVAAVELTLASLGVITLAGLAASMATEAHLRWHPRWWVARDGIRGTRMRVPGASLAFSGGGAHDA